MPHDASLSCSSLSTEPVSGVIFQIAESVFSNMWSPILIQRCMLCDSMISGFLVYLTSIYEVGDPSYAGETLVGYIFHSSNGWYELHLYQSSFLQKLKNRTKRTFLLHFDQD